MRERIEKKKKVVVADEVEFVMVCDCCGYRQTNKYEHWVRDGQNITISLTYTRCDQYDDPMIDHIDLCPACADILFGNSINSDHKNFQKRIFELIRLMRQEMEGNLTHVGLMLNGNNFPAIRGEFPNPLELKSVTPKMKGELYAMRFNPAPLDDGVHQRVLDIFALINKKRDEGLAADVIHIMKCPFCGDFAKFGYAACNGHRSWKCKCTDVME